MKARDRVKLCIEQARNHSGETALRAVINAVEILADQLKDEHVGTYHPPMIAEIKTQDEPGDRTHDSAPNATPAPNLVERLKKAYVFAEMEAIAGGGDPVDLGVRAILTSLSTTPVAMMTADHVATLCGGEDYSPTDRRYARVAVQAFQEFIAPIVAAKDARITELESSHSTTVEAMQAALNMAKRDYMAAQTALDATKDKLQRTEQDLGAKKTRIAEIEKQLATARTDIETHVTQARCAAVNLGYPDKTLEDAVRAVATDKVIVDIDGKDSRLLKILEREQRECVEALSESLLVMPGRTLVEAVKDLIELHGSAKKKFDELEKEVTRQQGVIRLQNKTMEDHVSRGVHEAMVADLRAKVDGLEKRIAELTAPMTVDGKTPGQTLRSSLGAILRAGNDVDERLEQAGQAVLRAFGQSSQTQQTNAVEALRRVHSAIKFSLSLLPYNTSFMNGVAVVRKDNVEKNVQRTFDAEIAKLEAMPVGKAPECFLCGKGPHDHTMMVLESLPEQFEVKWCNGRRQNFGTEKPAWWDVPKSDHVHELKSCSFCDKQAPNPTPTQAQKRFKYNRAWLSEQTDDALFDLYMEHVGFFDMNGAMVERANMIETLATIEQEQAITLPTKPTMPLRERLEELATYWEKGAAYEGMPEQYRRGLKDCAKELREELAKLSAEPNNVTTPKFFANENELRGSYFCTQFPFRPFLHIGHDIEFDDIPRILKLGRNDIIEVRVVERAKQ